MAPTPSPRTPWRFLAGLAVSSRALALVCGALAVWLIGYPAGESIPKPHSDNFLVELPTRWDTGWYVGLASSRYHWDGAPGHFENIAFFPAYPLALHAVAWSWGGGSPARWNWAGVALSTVFFAAGLASLWALAAAVTTSERARWCAVLCATFPFALFFGLPYSESLFFAAVTTTFVAFEREVYVGALVSGIIVGLSRPTGVLTAVALAAAWAERARARRGTGTGWTSRGVAATAICGPVLGMGLYSAFVYGLTGHPFMWALVQEGWGRPVQNPVLALAGPLTDFAMHPMATAVGRPHDVLNALAGVLALALVVPIGRRLGLGQAVFVLLGTVVPLAGGGVASLGRYTSVLFPIYVWLAAALPPGGLWPVAAVFAVLQVVVASLFFTWRPMY